MIRVIGDRVLVALPPRQDETVSAGGIVLVKDPDRFAAPTQGIVVALGEKSGTVDVAKAVEAVTDFIQDFVRRKFAWTAGELIRVVTDLGPAPFDVEIGDCVIFPPSAGEEIHDDGIDYVILREAEILGIVEPKASAA